MNIVLEDIKRNYVETTVFSDNEKKLTLMNTIENIIWNFISFICVSIIVVTIIAYLFCLFISCKLICKLYL